MNNENNDEVIVDNEEANNEVQENTEETTPKAEKPKWTPQEEFDYHNGKAQRLAKKLGLNSEKSQPKEVTNSSKPNELTDGQIAILRTEGIKTKAEIALFNEIMSETGKGVLDLLDSSYFKSRLTEFRSNQETQNAIPKGKNRSGQTGVTDEDIAYAKFQETGELPSDFKTRTSIVNKMVEAEKSKNMFSGSSVIGPQGQSF